MKCQHCGINFDDGDRECPICGARAGSRGRLSVRRGASFRPHGSAAPKTTEPTILNGKVKKDRAAQKKKGRVIALVSAAVVLLQLVPAVFGLIGDFVGDIRFGEPYVEPEPPYSEADDWYEDDGGAYNVISLADLLGLRSIVELPDGSLLELYAEGDEHYSLYIEGRYSESGDVWIMYNAPDDELYPDIAQYPPEEYDSFTICLTYDSLEWEEPAVDISYHQEMGDMWLLAHISRDGSEIVLDDWFGDAAFLFGEEQFLPVKAVETA